MGLNEFLVHSGRTIFLFEVLHGHLMVLLPSYVELGLHILQVGLIEGRVEMLGHEEFIRSVR